MVAGMGRSAASLLGITVLSLSMAGQAQAITFTGTNGSNLSALAHFTTQGGNLQVVLTNTSASDVWNPAQVLTGVFFSVAGPSNFSSLSAVLTVGSTVIYDLQGQPAGGVVGGEWAYGTNLSGAPNGATSGISSSGLGLFGNPTFPGPNLQNPVAVNGVQYGIVSAGDNVWTGNGGIFGSGGLIRNSVTFTLGNIGANFNLAGISNVSFQYGTSLSEPNIPSRGVPEPSTLLLMGAGLAGIGIWRRKFANS